MNAADLMLFSPPASQPSLRSTMVALPPASRRQWLKTTAAGLAGLAFSRQLLVTPAHAQSSAPAPAVPIDLARLSGNENSLGPSPLALKAMRDNLERSHYYPFAEQGELVKKIAALESVPTDHIVMGVGSGEILEIFGIYLGREKGEVVTATPGYLQMASAMQRMGSTIVSAPLNDKLEHDLDAMAAKVGSNTKCVYICNPNNPTGTIVDAAKLRAFCIEVSKKCPVFIDEAYLQCADDFAGNTMVGLVRDGHNVAVARTFSKLYGLAGMRVGYGVMQPAMARSIRDYSTGSLNLLGVAAASASLDDATYVPEMRAKIKAGRTALVDVVKSLGRRYAEPHGNFVFFHTGMPIETFQAKMREEHVVVARPFPPLRDWARISVGKPREMEMCHAALRKVLGKTRA
jgi:histidinol-phosphate aminotransferase